jgi:uncharacterized repeat protein (TIGR01451 family)
MRKLLRAGALAAFACGLLLIAPGQGSRAGPVATTDELYQLCGRVFTDPHAYWPSPAQTPARSPWAKGNAVCPATDFLSYADMVEGAEYLETLFPQFIEFYKLEEDFGDGSDCATSTSNADMCSAGLPNSLQGRDREDLYLLRVTDERVPDDDKKFFTFPLSIHGIERAGAEAGVRAAEDLATWAACEAGLNTAIVNCAQEGALPHPILETQPDESVSGGEALERSAIYFVFANPDGWRRGDPDNLIRFYQRYNGNGVDMNRDWPTIGYTFEGYTPWSEPETRSFGKVMQQIRSRWDGGIDLHGQLIDRAFSFTMIGASERNFSKNQRVLQTVKGAWADAETRLAWNAQIKPNDAAPQPDDPRMYGVQWGTVWDTIGYTTTGSFGDWIDSPLGLDADGIDNEMSFSHLINCGVGSCYLADYEQLHIDGNKSLIYAMVNFTLQPEDTTFSVPGKVGYVFNPKRLVNDGELLTPPPTAGLPPQEAILDVRLDPTNNFTYAFEVKGADDGVYNGGLEGRATHVNAEGVSAGALTTLILEQYRPTEETPQEDAGCGNGDDRWGTVNTYYDQSALYLQAGQAVHTNMPIPGVYRICVRGELTTSGARDKATAGSVDLDITFTNEKAWENPGQLPYDVTNMKFFDDLAKNMAPGQLVPVNVDDILSGSVDLDQFTSIIVADDPLPGFTEPIAEGPAQEGFTHEPPTAAAATAPCAWPTPGASLSEPPPTCVADYEFDIDPAFNNQQIFVQLDSPESIENDWDLYLQRQSRVTGDWFTVGSSTSSTGDELIQVIAPPVGHYRARIVNWAGTVPPSKLEVRFSNEYAGPPIEPSERTHAERDAWGAKLRDFVEAGGNLVLTDGAIRNVAYMDALPRTVVNTFGVYAGFIALTRDGQTSTYGDPLAQNLNQPGAAEGPGFRHQTYEPVPLGFNIGNDLVDVNSAPAWGVDQIEWEKAGGRTVGITTADQVTLGELEIGDGVVRLLGALVPMPTERYYHPFGLANYALTYSGYQVLNNVLQWQRPATDLAVTKTDSPDPLFAGQQLTYTVRVTNNGPALATGATVTDTLPAGSTFVSASSTQGTCSGTATVTCGLGTIASGATVTVTIKIKPNTPGTITNTASVIGDGPDPNPGNNSSTATTRVNPAADLAVTKTDSPDPVHIGQALTYTIKVTNNGPQTATGVTLSDTLPKGAGFGSTTTSQGTCSFKPDKRMVTCNLGNLASGATATVTIIVKPTSKGTITNTATVTGSPTDPNTTNNKAVATTSVIP